MLTQKLCQRGLICLLITFCGIILGISFLLTPPTAQADPIYDWAKWKVEFDFVGNHLNAEWTVIVGGPDGSIIHTQPLTCTAHGGVAIIGNVAHLDGVNDYFSCYMPSFAHTVHTVTSGTLNIGNPANDGCTLIGPDDTAFAAFRGRPEYMVASSSPNPVINHPDIQLAIPMSAVNEGSLTFQARGSNTQSTDFPIRAPEHYLSLLACDASSTTSCEGAHRVGGTIVTTQTVSTPPQILTTGEAYLYVGHTPGTSDYYKGTIETGVGDPSCPMDGD